MPGFDATGPRGEGPGTGWGLGRCGASRRRGKVGGCNQGPWWFTAPASYWGGPRWGRRFISSSRSPEVAPGGTETPGNEIQFLSERLAYLQEELEAIKHRLAELHQ